MHGPSSCGKRRVLCCSSFSHLRARDLGMWASAAVACVLCCCSTSAQVAPRHGIFLWPGIKPTSLALARLLTTGPQMKSSKTYFLSLLTNLSYLDSWFKWIIQHLSMSRLFYLPCFLRFCLHCSMYKNPIAFYGWVLFCVYTTLCLSIHLLRVLGVISLLSDNMNNVAQQWTGSFCTYIWVLVFSSFRYLH